MCSRVCASRLEYLHAFNTLWVILPDRQASDNKTVARRGTVADYNLTTGHLMSVYLFIKNITTKSVLKDRNEKLFVHVDRISFYARATCL